ncbi:cytochrome c oxidase accessory protein CcoG [Jiella sonneratiae]|uniref:Cytochrome c oxidase accessory protein CcoG n=1 Tax=Jiella sonneratiae TaxID=2816856 RepID=A0ABS3JB02_9HYPH|nr:cytochrome c oxidase accessory protein CcoG [Jiella sonneratiae]MBO0906143.1 cytochrome c oxidase accessory protein CcoG [Jiella sonneratiae]
MLQGPEISQFDVAPVNSPEAQQTRPLYAKRQKIHPKRAEGSFRRLKWIIMAVTLGIYYVTPWLRWDRGPFAPDQAVLIDLAHRRFYFFFIEIWPQEFIFVAGLLVMAGVGLFLVTSVVGRAWCGYTCPQTVWTDLFLVVERFFEGDRNARIRLDAAPWSFDKLRKRAMKHATWLLISVATGGAWIFYFADAPNLLQDFVEGDAPFVAYSTVAILTATTYVLGGFMREQVCIYMCPWPRIQAAMLDEDSLVVTYNDWRGEPRSHGARRAKTAGLSVGDCVDCNACVAVCPVGIDIRDGQQLACITCALCIDACNGVMDKLGRERGLISYATLRDYDSNVALATSPVTHAIEPERVRDVAGRFVPAVRHFDWHVFLRLRTLIYAGLWAAIGLGMLFLLTARERLELNVQRDRNPVYVRLSDGSIRNGFTVKLLNMIPEPREFVLSLEGLPQATMFSDELKQPEGRSFAVTVDPDRLRTLKVFVAQPKDAVEPGSSDFRFVLRDMNSSESAVYDAAFEAPEKGR